MHGFSLIRYLFAVGVFISIPISSVRAGADCERYFAPGAVAGSTPVASAKLIVISAPSGGGKTTLAQMLLKDVPSLVPSVSFTTRAPRGQEKNGVDYNFISRAEFEAKAKAGAFAEWAEVHGNYYGTSRELIESSLKAGRSVVLLIDVKGAETMRAAFPGRVHTVFIVPPDLKTLEERLRARGTETEAAIRTRIANAEKEMAEAPRFDSVIVNDRLETAYGELLKLVFDRGLAPGATP